MIYTRSPWDNTFHPAICLVALDPVSGFILLEHEPSKLRLSQKRRKAAWNDDYRAKVVFGQ